MILFQLGEGKICGNDVKNLMGTMPFPCVPVIVLPKQNRREQLKLWIERRSGMKKINSVLLFLVIFFSASYLVRGQEERSRIGIGVGLSTLFELPSFYLPINVSSQFRLEPAVSFHRHSESSFFGEEISTTFSAGCGIFRVVGKGKVDMYYGARTGFVSRSYGTVSMVDFSFDPAIGGDYLFDKHFSLGGEIQLNCVFIGLLKGRDSGEIKTKTLFFVRWYF